jgi:hypothetical protein
MAAATSAMLPPFSPHAPGSRDCRRTVKNEETAMLRWIACISCGLALTFSASFVLAQTEFSAEVVSTHKEGAQPQAKIYFSKDKVRFNSQDRDSKSGSGAFILNLATQSITVLMPQQHMYMELPAETQGRRQMFSFFRTMDVENACDDWLKLNNNKGGSCHKVGSETISGRSTVEYEGTNAKGEVSHIWLDPKLRFPLKWQSQNEGGELRNIQEGSQPSSLFEVPSGFTKMDMGGMERR